MSTMQLDSRLPIYQQIMLKVEELIVSESIHPGAELLSRRELARQWGINPNTVQRAFSEMESLGWIKTETGLPSRLTADEAILKSIKDAWTHRAIERFVDEIAILDLTIDEINQLVSAEYAKRKEAN